MLMEYIWIISGFATLFFQSTYGITIKQSKPKSYLTMTIVIAKHAKVSLKCSLARNLIRQIIPRQVFPGGSSDIIQLQTLLIAQLKQLKSMVKVTAAVFPTPEVARRNVRQDWVNWNLTGVFPMVYHGFYKEHVFGLVML